MANLSNDKEICKPSTIKCVNWHVTEACNYKCHYCFAKWKNQAEIWRDPNKVANVIERIKSYSDKTGIGSIRLNIVGGEPILQTENLWNMVEQARNSGLEVSLITNGTHLDYIHPFAHMLSQVGISIDSFNLETNQKIGRCCCCGKTLSYEELGAEINMLRILNQNARIKINSVVNAFNFHENLYSWIQNLQPNKWKILRQMPFGNNNGISDMKFYSFIVNNGLRDLVSSYCPFSIYVEDNNVMTESYLMISPDGRLFQNGGADYKYSRPLTEVPFDEALKDISFKENKFNDRYEQEKTRKIVERAYKFFHLRTFTF